MLNDEHGRAFTEHSEKFLFPAHRLYEHTQLGTAGFTFTRLAQVGLPQI
jgi:hypothetical protein